MTPIAPIAPIARPERSDSPDLALLRLRRHSEQIVMLFPWQNSLKSVNDNLLIPSVTSREPLKSIGNHPQVRTLARKDWKIKRNAKVLKRSTPHGEQNRTIEGDLVEIAGSDQADERWSSYLQGLPDNIFNFVLEASSNSLPVRRCSHCRKGRTLKQVLQSCLPELVAERHDTILGYIVSNIGNKSLEYYADLDGKRTLDGNTIPSVTRSRFYINLGQNSRRLKPDLVIIEHNIVYIFEISVPFEQNIERRHEDKESKYQIIQRDIKRTSGLQCQLHCIEIGSRGFLTRRNRSKLALLYMLTNRNLKLDLTEFINKISTLACVASFNIYQRHQTFT